MSGPVAVVTGGGGDIGRAIAVALAADGYAVLAADLDAVSAAATADAIGGGAFACRCDVTDPLSVAAMAESAMTRGVVSVLVNNAGGASAASLAATDIVAWRRDLALNVDGAFLCFKAFADALVSSKGSVVNIASVNAIGVYGHPAYSAAKAALVHFTRLIAVEYGKHGIRANAVAPGSVMTQAWKARLAANPALVEETRRWYPLGRVASTEDVANAVRFLVSPGAGAITGVCLPVDAGLTAGQTQLAATFSQSPDY